MAKRRTAADWQRHVDGWARSGLTGVEYAKRHGVSPGVLYAWKHHLSREAAPTTRVKSRSGRKPSQARRRPVRFAPAQLAPAASPPASSLEVVLGNGRVVRITGPVEPTVLSQTLLAVEAMSSQ